MPKLIQHLASREGSTLAICGAKSAEPLPKVDWEVGIADCPRCVARATLLALMEPPADWREAWGLA